MPKKQVPSSPRSSAAADGGAGRKAPADTFAQPGQHVMSNYAMAAAPLLFTFGWAAKTLQAHPLLWSPLGLLVAVSIIAAQVTNSLIGTVKQWTLKAGLGGFDINKKGTPAGEHKVPESLGIVVGTMHMICVILFQVYYYTAAGETADIYKVKREEYNAALAATIFMMFLGFADDVLDLRWRYKMILPTIASLPLLVSYAGSTTVILPNPFAQIFGRVIELGVLYKVWGLGFRV